MSVKDSNEYTSQSTVKRTPTEQTLLKYPVVLLLQNLLSLQHSGMCEM